MVRNGLQTTSDIARNFLKFAYSSSKAWLCSVRINHKSQSPWAKILPSDFPQTPAVVFQQPLH